MNDELVVHFMPQRTTYLIDEFISGNYKKMLLSSDKGYVFNKDSCYKVYYIIEKTRLDDWKEQGAFMVDGKYMSKVFYNNYYEILSSDYEGYNNKIPKNISITMDELKKWDLGMLHYIIGREIFSNKDTIMNEDTFDLEFKASFGLEAKCTKDIGFYGSNGYYEGGYPKMNGFYINGIRLIKYEQPLKYLFDYSFLPFNIFYEELLFPEKFHERKM